MNRFWDRYIKPIFETVQPTRVLEIGADAGWNTRHVLAYCRAAGARADIVDPQPRPALHEVLAAYPQEHTFHPLPSYQAIPGLEMPDLALIDGDHNWFTVYTELDLLYGLAIDQQTPPPIILLHDVGWPYARRDMYYNPDAIPALFRHPYAYAGVLPGVSELQEAGMNSMLANATQEGGPRNGVLTAIEDFVTSLDDEVQFYQLPFFNGLGILIPQERRTPSLQALVDSFFAPESLLEACVQLERDDMQLRARLCHAETLLTRRTEALKRASKLLAEKTAELDRLRELYGNGAVHETQAAGESD